MISIKEQTISTRTKLLALLLAFTTVQLAQAQAPQWGTLTGKFVVQGKTPQPAALNRGGAVCGPGPLLAETLVVGPQGELKNVAIWIAPPRGESAPQPHPNYLQLANTPINIDNLACVYVPHVEVIWTKRPVHFRNRDPIAHNYKVDGFLTTFNTLVPANGVHVQKFEKEERVPAVAACSIHPWMSAYLVIRDSPYAAATASDGTFTIENLPAGTWKFAFWHESGGYLSGLNLKGEKTDRRGQCEITIEPGKVTDLGEIMIQADDLMK